MVIAITIAWLIAAFVISSSLDTLGPAAAAADPHGASIVANQRTQGAIFIVVVDICILVWAGVSSFKRERQEYPPI